MNKKLFAQLLGLSESASNEEFEAAIVARLGTNTRLETLTGKKGDELHGVVMAWKASHDQLPGVQTKLGEAEAKLATQQASLEAQELDAAFAEAKKEHKVTPAIETELRRQLTAKESTLAGVKATLKALHPVKALAAAPVSAGPASATGASSSTAVDALRYEGKSWEEMSPAEKHNLYVDNREAYDALKTNYEQRKKG